MNVVIDTNIYSDFARGDQVARRWLRRANVVYVPVVVIGELKRGFYAGNRVSPNLKTLEEFLSRPSSTVLEITDETADHYGRLAAFLKKNGTPIPVNDVWIAALCVQYDLPLLTRDGDFRRLPQLTLL